MKTPITETERIDLQEKIRKALPGYGTPDEIPFTHPFPEYFLGHKEEIFEGEFFPAIGGTMAALPTGKAKFKLSGGKGMLAVGPQESSPQCPLHYVTMTVSVTDSPDAPQHVIGRFTLN